MAMLHDIEVDEYLKQCVDLVPEAINEEFARLSGDYAYWNEKLAAVRKALLEAEFQEKKVHARLYLMKKEAPEGRKPPTEAAVDSAILLEPEYEEAHLRTIGYQHEHDYLKGVLEALRSKREMLVSAGAHMRQEMDTDRSLRERTALKRVEQEGF